MARKTEAKNAAELEQEVDAGEDRALEAEAERDHRYAEAKARKEQKMETITLPRLPNGKPVEIKINSKVYSGQVRVPAEMVPQLIEMAEKVVQREMDIHVGAKYSGTGSGIAGMRRVGSV